jgi:hypothetical protein
MKSLGLANDLMQCPREQSFIDWTVNFEKFTDIVGGAEWINALRKPDTELSS